MLRRLGCALALTLLATLGLTACGGGDDKPAAAKKVEVGGVFRVDDLHDIAYTPGSDECTGKGALGGLLTAGASPVEILDPNGKQVAKGRLGKGTYKTPQGTCEFTFSAGSLTLKDGDYSAQVPLLNAETQFKAGNADKIVLTFHRA